MVCFQISIVDTYFNTKVRFSSSFEDKFMYGTIILKRRALSVMGKTKKRSDYISWDEYFMGVSILAAKRSKDPSTQVGACIVDRNNVILTTGYNGFPKGCSDDEFPWDREGEITKYPYVVHAELNAILNAQGKDLSGSKLYVDLFPCNECAKAIIQSGIKEIVYLSDKYADTPGVKASKMMLRAAGVKLVQMKPEIDEIVLNFKVTK